MTTEMIVREQPVPIADIRQHVNYLQDVMRDVMRDGEHYGVIPGCGDKPTLLKAGAEKLMLTFRLAPETEVEVIEMANGHREYRVKVTLYSITSGVKLGTGVGSCSTMESKYRFRGGWELTDQEVPKDYWKLRNNSPDRAQAILGGKGFAARKGDDGRWMIAVKAERVEHDNPADFYNTILKMAKKRALVDAVLTSTAASDCFTQDVEEMVDNGKSEIPKTEEKPKADRATNKQLMRIGELEKAQEMKDEWMD